MEVVFSGSIDAEEGDDKGMLLFTSFQQVYLFKR